MAIRKKLLFAFGSIALLVLAVGSYTISSSLSTENELEALHMGITKEIDALQSLAYHLEVASSNMREMLLEHSPEYHEGLAGLEESEISSARLLISQSISGAREALNDWEKALVVWVAHANKDGLHEIEKIKRRANFNLFQQKLLPYLKDQDLFLADFDAKGRMAAYQRFEGSLEPVFRKLHNDVEMFIIQEQKEADIVADELFAASQNTIKYNVVAIVTAFIIAILLGLYVSRSFTRPLDKLTSASLQISKGNLDQPLQLNTGDELQILAETFNAMLHSLKEYRDHMENMVEDRTAKLNAAKKAAEQASEIKSQFMSRVSHELRTPLNAVLGFGQLLREEETDVEKIEQLDGILCAGKHLLGLIDEVLDISRIEPDETDSSIENVSLSTALAECIAIVQPVAAERKVSISNNYANFPYVRANSFRLKQILLNLLSNAIKYNRELGTVSIDYTIVNGDRVRLKIADTGFGITPDKQMLAFEPFTPVATNKQIVEGSGIGLTITKKLIEAMGGSIGLESEEGVGSTFWIELPLGLNPVEAYPEVVDSTG